MIKRRLSEPVLKHFFLMVWLRPCEFQIDKPKV